MAGEPRRPERDPLDADADREADGERHGEQDRGGRGNREKRRERTRTDRERGGHRQNRNRRDERHSEVLGEQEAERKAATDPIIARLQARKEKFEFAGEVLRDDATFYLVLNPDELSIRETERAISQLTEYDLSVAGLVVNKVTPEPEDHEEGRGARYLRARCGTERERIASVRETFSEPIVAEIESRAEEVKGDLLGSVAEALEVDVAAPSPGGPA